MVRQIDIIEQNPWWKGKEMISFDKDIKEYEKTEIHAERKDIALEHGKIYVIRGPRRIGKTMWMKNKIKQLISNNIDSRKIMYFNCETLVSRARDNLRKVINFFLDMEAGENYIFLDEITYVEDWQTELKFLYDGGKLNNSVVVVTGSLPIVIKKGVEYMPGRGVEGNEYLIKPITFRDFILSIYKNDSIDRIHPAAQIFHGNMEKMRSARNLATIIKNLDIINPEESTDKLKDSFKLIYPFMSELRRLFEIYILTGGFPKVINNYFHNSFKINNSLYEEIVNYILGDITKINMDRETARQILIAVLRRIGSRYSYTSLSKDTGDEISHQTIILYIDALQNSYVLQTLYSYDFNKRMENIKGAKKIYFSDPFIFYCLKSMLSGKSGFELSVEYLQREENRGILVENIVATHLSRVKESPKMKEPITYVWFYYNDKGEIDFVYKKNDDEYLGLEVKYQEKVNIGDVRRIENIKNYILLSYETYEITENVIIVPAYMFLALLKSSEKNL